MKTLEVNNGNFTREGYSWKTLSGIDAIKQRIEHKLLLVKSNWFLNIESGIDWLNLFEKPVSFRRIKHEIKKELDKDINLYSLENVSIDLDSKNRSISINVLVKVLSSPVTVTVNFKE